MNPRSSNHEEAFRAKSLSFPEADALLADAGDLALGRTAHSPESKRQAMADVIGNTFMRLARIKEESELIAPALPEGEEPKITVGTLLSELDQERAKILEQHERTDGEPVNQFLGIHDERLDAIQGLTMYIEAVHNTPKENNN